jgi:hypothetical protein
MKVPAIETYLDKTVPHILYNVISLSDLNILLPLTKEEKELFGDWKAILSKPQAQEYLSDKCGYRVRLFRIEGDENDVPLLLGRTDNNSIKIIETND